MGFPNNKPPSPNDPKQGEVIKPGHIRKAAENKFLGNQNTVSDIKWLDTDEIQEAVRLIGEDRLAKVEFIYDIIAQVKWVPGKSPRDLAKLWGCPPATVRAYSAEAYRRFRSVLGDPEDLRGQLQEKLNYVVTSAMTAQVPMLTKDGTLIYADKPDHRAAVQGIQVLSELTGLKVRRHDHTVRHEQYKEEDLESLIKKGLAEVKQHIIETEGHEAHVLPQRVPSSLPDQNPGLDNEPLGVRKRTQRGEGDSGS